MLIWLDLETTGLDPVRDLVLEVAAIATDDTFQELGRFHRVSNVAKWGSLDLVDPFVIEMHAKNGLWVDSIRSDQTPDQIDNDMSQWLAKLMLSAVSVSPPSLPSNVTMVKHLPDFKKLQPQLAGSTISFDREFLRHHLPETLELLHYRNIDVSTINEMARRFWPAVWEGRPRNGAQAAHRAMADIEESLLVAKYYTRALGPSLLSGSGTTIECGVASDLCPGASDL